MATSTPVLRRKPGRPKTGHTVEKMSVMIPPALREWAMNQPEGFSALVRRLLQEEQRKNGR